MGCYKTNHDPRASSDWLKTLQLKDKNKILITCSFNLCGFRQQTLMLKKNRNINGGDYGDVM